MFFKSDISLDSIKLSRFLKSFYFGVSLGLKDSAQLFFLNANSSFVFFGLVIFFFKLILFKGFISFFLDLEIIFFNFLSVFMSKFYYTNAVIFHLFYITNLDIFLLLNLIFVLVYGFLALHNGLIIPGFSQSNFEFLYNFIAQTGFSHNGWKGQRHFVFFIVLFLFILISNFLGMVPFSFTVTSHIFQTFALGCGVILSITILAISKNGLLWFKFFFPSLPIFILPLFTCIEFVSYISRAFSLAIRLFANLMSGHTLLNILTGFILKIGSKGFVSFLIALIPFFLISAIILLEMVIAILQAYVFVTLVTIYLKDAYSVGH
jgi:F-type H+-transporting ATPase subunit a